MGNIKQINTKNRTRSSFNDIKIETDKNSYKNIDIY